MSTQTNNGFMLIFRGTDWHKGLSPEETQQVAGQWMAWFKRLSCFCRYGTTNLVVLVAVPAGVVTMI
jgi:hypothetical protein